MFHHQARNPWLRVAVAPAVAVLVLSLFAALAPAASAKTNHPRRPGLHLSAAQKQCLAQHGVQAPTAGSRASLTTQQRQALASAMQECGVKFSRGRGFGGPRLTSAQRTCLTQYGVPLPGGGGGLGAPGANRQAYAAAAQACGIHRGGGAPPTS